MGFLPSQSQTWVPASVSPFEGVRRTQKEQRKPRALLAPPLSKAPKFAPEGLQPTSFSCPGSSSRPGGGVAELSSPLPRPHAERRGRTSGPRAASLPDRGAIQPAGAQTRASCAPEPETTGPHPTENKEQPTRKEALRAAPLEGCPRAGGAGLTPPRPVAGPSAGQRDGTLPSQESGTSESKSPSPGPGKSLSPTVHQFGVLGALDLKWRR